MKRGGREGGRGEEFVQFSIPRSHVQVLTSPVE